MRVNKIKTDTLLTKQLSLLTKQAVYFLTSSTCHPKIISKQ